MWLGFPLADPIIGLIITVVIFGIVWRSAKAVLTRMLDGIDPDVIAAIRHTAEHVPGLEVREARARWLGHRLEADLVVGVEPALSVATAVTMVDDLTKELREHLPALDKVAISFATKT